MLLFTFLIRICPRVYFLILELVSLRHLVIGMLQGLENDIILCTLNIKYFDTDDRNILKEHVQVCHVQK